MKTSRILYNYIKVCLFFCLFFYCFFYKFILFEWFLGSCLIFQIFSEFRILNDYFPFQKTGIAVFIDVN